MEKIRYATAPSQLPARPTPSSSCPVSESRPVSPQVCAISGTSLDRGTHPCGTPPPSKRARTDRPLDINSVYEHLADKHRVGGTGDQAAGGMTQAV